MMQAELDREELLYTLKFRGLVMAIAEIDAHAPNSRLARHFLARCLKRVLCFFEAERPDDNRMRAYIDTLEDDSATEEKQKRALVEMNWAAQFAAKENGWRARRAAFSGCFSKIQRACEEAVYAVGWSEYSPGDPNMLAERAAQKRILHDMLQEGF